MIWRGSLFFKYAIPLVFLVMGGLVISGLVEIYFSYKENKSALARIQHEKAAAAAIRIEQFVRELEHNLSWIAQTPWGPRGVPLDQRRLDSLRLLRQVPTITEVSHIDPTGHEQLRVSRLAMDVIGSNTDLSQEPKYLEAMARKTYFSPINFRKESEPYMTIAISGVGEDAGVVAAEANLKFIWDVVSELKVGKGGNAYVVDEHGRLIAHPDISLVLQKTDLSTLPQVRAAAVTSRRDADTSDEAMVGRDVRGSEVLSAHAAITPLNWSVFVELPITEAYASLYASIWRTVILVLVGVVISIIASLFLVRRMVSPIQALRAGAARIGAGALEHRIAVKSGDELQALAEEFNRMTERLQESYAGLERKVEERTRDLTEALEQQTATSEILQVISSSPTDLQPVLDTVARSAARLCEGNDAAIYIVEGSFLKPAAVVGPLALHPLPLTRETVTGRAVIDRRTVHVEDILTSLESDFPDSKPFQAIVGYRTILATPLLREGVSIGAILTRRTEVRPFSQKQIDLLKTFADQSVIAIENVRLFKELQSRTQELARSVEQLGSLAGVSQAVNSTLDLDQVLSTIVAQAVELSSADGGAVYEFNEATQEFRPRATYGYPQDLVERLLATPLRIGEGATGRAAAERTPIQIPDIRAEGAYTSPLQNATMQAGARAVLAVPLLREERILGSLVVSRKSVGEFPAEIVDLLQTFAGQSTLAIQNARLFSEIEQKGRELEIASQHKSQFLANMSHELRTPLNAILGYTELIVDGIYGKVPAKILDVQDRVQKSGRHLLGLINDVLDLSKIEAGQLTLSLSDYSFQDAVQSVVASVESLAREKGLRLTVEVAQRLPVGRADERRIVQVLLNLVGNAIKFTDAGEVKIGVNAVDAAFIVSVSDTGPGIPKSQHERIFEEFQQVDGSSTRAKGGTGLGLAIAKKIIALHGGRIWVESVVGEGSTFSFSVPVRTERHEEAA
ncbi:MAG TPA: ATP-binding protein [Burkholderiales bacterium]|nr:ATP-binding protein [Burkholderiales bacterium]